MAKSRYDIKQKCMPYVLQPSCIFNYCFFDAKRMPDHQQKQQRVQNADALQVKEILRFHVQCAWFVAFCLLKNS